MECGPSRVERRETRKKHCPEERKDEHRGTWEDQSKVTRSVVEIRASRADAKRQDSISEIKSAGRWK